MRVLLSGFMGAGKTTVGRLLATRLGMEFRDLDEMVEERAGQSVRALFESVGEEEFRRLERAALGEACALDPVVVALGGGTLSNRDAFETAKASGLVVWLNPPFAVIARRIGGRGKNDRPLFRDEVSAFDLYRQRLPVYRQADLVVDVGADEEASEVASRLAMMVPPRAQERTCTT